MGKKYVIVQTNTHPDGGWGWCVVAAAYFTQFVVIGLQNSFGVLFNELIEKYNESKGKTAWVGSMSIGIMFLLGPLSTYLCEKFGCRLVSFAGATFCAVSLFVSSLTNQLNHMFFTYGMAWGIGTAFCYFPTLIILVPYFDRRLALVNGIVSSGSGFGTLVLSPFLQWFTHKFGLTFTFYLLAGLHVTVALASLAYRPLKPYYKEMQERHQKEVLDADTTKDSSKSLLREGAYIVWCLGLSVFMIGYFVPFVHLVRYATTVAEIDENKAAFLIGIMSIVATVCKLLVGSIAGLSCVNQLVMYQLGLLCMGMANTLLPVSNHYISLIVYAVIFGMSESCFIVMIPLITKDIVGTKRLPRAIGCLFMLMSLPTMLGPPVAGWIYDFFKVYAYAFYLAGAMNTIGVLIMFFIHLFKEKQLLSPPVTPLLSNEKKRLLLDPKKDIFQDESLTDFHFSSPVLSRTTPIQSPASFEKVRRCPRCNLPCYKKKDYLLRGYNNNGSSSSETDSNLQVAHPACLCHWWQAKEKEELLSSSSSTSCSESSSSETKLLIVDRVSCL